MAEESMSTASYMSLDHALARLEEADAALLRTVSGLDDRAVREPSLCEGWSRAHVIAHLARNAEAMQRLVTWAETGVPTQSYASPEGREREIEESAKQDAVRLRVDLATASEAFRMRASHLRGRSDLATVRNLNGMPLAGDQIPWARLREVVFHHVDLDAGFTFADAPPDVVRAGLQETVDRLSGRVGCPPLTLVGTDGRRWHVGGGGQEVRGRPSQLLLWLARGRDEGLESHAPLPPLPRWG
jgi:maleylpyruvate isomerase